MEGGKAARGGVTAVSSWKIRGSQPDTCGAGDHRDKGTHLWGAHQGQPGTRYRKQCSRVLTGSQGVPVQGLLHHSLLTVGQLTFLFFISKKKKKWIINFIDYLSHPGHVRSISSLIPCDSVKNKLYLVGRSPRLSNILCSHQWSVPWSVFRPPLKPIHGFSVPLGLQALLCWVNTSLQHSL